MKPASPLFDSIRVGKKRGKSAGKEKATAPAGQTCQWEGCDKPGTHKAPMGRDREGMFLWLCFEHVREYNKNYNYFSGLDDEAIAKFQKDAVTGHRPTWEMGANRWGNAAGGDGAAPDADPRAMGAERLYNRSRYAANARAGRMAYSRTRKLKSLEKKSFDDLNLSYTATAEDIKARYKLLVKQNHPDANGGDRSSEEQLRRIIQAYKLLQRAGFC